MKTIRLLLHTCPHPELDLALEESIHQSVESGSSPETWRLWQAAKSAVILGTGQESALEADLTYAGNAGVPVLRRHSGGGAVLIGPGTINYSAFFRYEDRPGSQTIKGAMAIALAPIRHAISILGVECFESGLSDLAVLENQIIYKIAGNSQARKKHSCVAHGTLLTDPNWDLLGNVLRHPSSLPEYRANRNHRDFLRSLKDLGVSHGMNEFSAAVLEAIAAETNGAPILVEYSPTTHETDLAHQLHTEKYSQKEWHLRR